MMNRVFLFDIDGTLLKIKNKANRKIIQQILVRFGKAETDVKNIDFAGKTDRDIFSNLLDDPDETLFDLAKEAYVQALEKKLAPEDIHVYDGITTTLHYLSTMNVHIGLLTGNFAHAAHIKLERSGLRHFFDFGAFGDDFKNRNDLPPSAYRKLKARTKHPYQPSDLVIIGDTPRDILCAQSFGAVSVAVATGGHTAEELATYHPDIVLASLQAFPEWMEQFHNSSGKRHFPA